MWPDPQNPWGHAGHPASNQREAAAQKGSTPHSQGAGPEQRTPAPYFHTGLLLLYPTTLLFSFLFSIFPPFSSSLPPCKPLPGPLPPQGSSSFLSSFLPDNHLQCALYPVQRATSPARGEVVGIVLLLCVACLLRPQTAPRRVKCMSRKSCSTQPACRLCAHVGRVQTGEAQTDCPVPTGRCGPSDLVPGPRPPAAGCRKAWPREMQRMAVLWLPTGGASVGVSVSIHFSVPSWTTVFGFQGL